jgi:hypothetical protein
MENLGIVVVIIIIVFFIGRQIGIRRHSKAVTPYLLKQHACLVWSLQFVHPDNTDDKNALMDWNKDFGIAMKVAEGDIDEVLP